MLEGHVARCRQRIVEEEALAREAASPDIALAHSQAAMILKSEVAMLERRSPPKPCRAADVGQMLADLW